MTEECFEKAKVEYLLSLVNSTLIKQMIKLALFKSRGISMSKKKEPFTKVPNRIIRNIKLTPLEFRVLVYLMSLNPCYPSITKIAKDGFLSRKSVVKALKALIKMGLIRKSKQGGPNAGSNHYVVLEGALIDAENSVGNDVHHLVELSNHLVENLHQGSVENTPEVVTQVASKKNNIKRTNKNMISMCEGIANLWNQMAAQTGLAIVRTPLSEDRVKKSQKYLKEFPEKEDWIKIIKQVPQSEFRLGQVETKDGRKPWKASFDWLFQKNNCLQLIEEYENENN